MLTIIFVALAGAQEDPKVTEVIWRRALPDTNVDELKDALIAFSEFLDTVDGLIVSYGNRKY